MPKDLDPIPSDTTRADIAERVRKTAANTSKSRVPYIAQRSNGDLAKAQNADGATICAIGTFTKGLTHDDHGRVTREDLEAFIDALNQPHANPAQNPHSPFPGVYGSGLPAEFNAPLFKGSYHHNVEKGVRGWESPISGHTFDLMGCDADATGMPPAPTVGSSELTAEMAEVYCAALLRDTPFSDWEADTRVASHADMLKSLPFFTSDDGLDAQGARRRNARLLGGDISASTMLRGSTIGAMVGPYISQFMLIGNAEHKNPTPDGTAKSGVAAQTRAQSFGSNELVSTGKSIEPDDGIILYGVQGISQKFKAHKENVDHMTTWSSWHDVQNGADLKGVGDQFQAEARFVHTPRDLATYVHFDALYQAYLNAVLILSGMGANTDIGLPEGGNSTQKQRDAFATFGGPHILSLVTEVATRALKAVRRQKFNIHLRSRPEAIAAGISLAWKGGSAAKALGPFEADCDAMKKVLLPLLHEVKAHNEKHHEKSHVLKSDKIDKLIEGANALLPMAFPEGSPMHAAYGAGHATVAGACVTVVKAFFEMYDHDRQRGGNSIYDIVAKKDHKVLGYPGTYPADLFKDELLLTDTSHTKDKEFAYNPLPSAYVPDSASDGTTLTPWKDENLTIQGELDKLAANISIGRNFAGVHYYTDYFESLRMGERIAVSILQEQMLTYREPVSMRFKSFDGDHILIAGTGGTIGANDALVFVWDEDGNGGTEQDFKDWWNRHR